MRDGADRRPGAVPDLRRDADGGVGGVGGVGGPALDGPAGTDTDADGHPDTLLTADGADLLVLTDLDGDGLADRALRIGPDGSVRAEGPPPLAPPHGPDGPVAGHAPAHSLWSTLLGLCGLDP